ncbi:MAG: hypothetical protein GY708_15420 [Actinomycetia bacterium]|nr:hypothetical protein [Actinomycetes bacterium]MCP4961519.1 hypothetical protein [Actinomycetes bacterium]
MPQWLDAERLTQLSVGVMFLLAVGALLVTKVIKAVVTMTVYLVLIGLAIFAVWSQRDSLKECQATCSCSLFGNEVTVPDNPSCGDQSLPLDLDTLVESFHD